jgi:hypothetical protein
MTMAAMLGQAAWAANRQWRALPPERRDRAQALLRQSGGRPGNLSAAERQELRTLLADLNLGAVVRDSMMRASRGSGFR